MNPWTELSTSGAFVLACDSPVIEAFNITARAEHAIHTELLPEPFLGNPDAPVVLLNMNPGFSAEDEYFHRLTVFRDAALANLRHGNTRCPFYLFDSIVPASPGREWWRKKLAALIGAAGEENVAAKLFVLELHGYHSKRFSSELKLPSQEYTRHLLWTAIDRGARLVIMRGHRQWESLVPNLAELASVQHVRSVQNPAITPGNLGGPGFGLLVEALTA